MSSADLPWNGNVSCLITEVVLRRPRHPFASLPKIVAPCLKEWKSTKFPENEDRRAYPTNRKRCHPY